MYKWEEMDRKLERAEDATEERANALAELLGSYAEELTDIIVYAEYDKLKSFLEQMAEEIQYAADLVSEDDEVRRNIQKAQSEMTEAEEWEEVEQEEQ